MKIPFNKPFFIGNETKYISQAVKSGKISGDGMFTEKCHDFFEKRYGFKKVLLTTSCTDALEMAAILLNINQGDEVIMPSYTFVSTANAFVLRGANIIFADSMEVNPNVDAEKIEALVTSKTKAIVVVHYAGIACDMERIMEIAKKHHLYVVEDAAQAVDSFYIGKNGERKALGSIGHLAAFSFHETKNIIAGEGGMLVVNDEQFMNRAEIIWEKGTNRSAFFRGEVDKYNWVDMGSSFLPSEIVAAFLYAQLEHLEEIQTKRISLWNQYRDGLQDLLPDVKIGLPFIPEYTENNAHLFYLLFSDDNKRDQTINYLKSKHILSVFHYLSLHQSPFYQPRHDGRQLVNADRYSNTLLRLPMYFDLTHEDIESIIGEIKNSFN